MNIEGYPNRVTDCVIIIGKGRTSTNSNFRIESIPFTLEDAFPKTQEELRARWESLHYSKPSQGIHLQLTPWFLWVDQDTKIVSCNQPSERVAALLGIKAPSNPSLD